VGPGPFIHQPARMDEVIAAAWALGVSVAAILDEHPLAERVIVHTHPARQDSGEDSVKQRLVGFLEADAQLEETSHAAENCGQ
jgi:hypothetical protein